MKTFNDKLIGLSKEISKDNIQKSWKTAEKLTRPSKATRIGSLVGTSVGVGIFCVGLLGSVLGSGILGIGGLTAGAVTIVSNISNLKKTK